MHDLLYSIRQGFALLVFVVLLSVNLSAQKFFDPNTFTGIRSEGTLPDDFLRSWGEKFQEELTSSVSGDESRKERKKIEAFWGSQYHMIDAMLQSGRFSFNDPATNYLNKIVDHLLKDDPELRKEIRVYLYRSPSVNAAVVADGIVMVHTGLFAHANSEAELAFVLAHEIAHYTEAHLLDRFNEREKVLRSTLREYRNLNTLQQIDLLTMRSQEHELDADDKGLQLFLKSDYATQGVEGCLDVLHQSYMPYGRKEVERDFLSVADFSLPEIFFRDSVSPISREEDYFDETHSHPNVYKRREAMRSVLATSDKGEGKDFLQPRELFFELRNLARFELVRENIIYRNYGRALYDIYLLEDEFPGSKFLEISRAKALYGLAGFKAINEYRFVARSTSRVEGPSQQVHHVLKQFDRNQLTALALHHLIEVQKKYPEEEYLRSYIDQLSMYLLVHCKLSPDDFKTEEPSLLAFNAKPEDYRSERAYFRAHQNHYRDIYKYLLQREYKSGWLMENLSKHQWIADSLEAEKTMLAKEKRKREKDEMRELKKSGAGLNIRKMIILDPTLIVRSDDNDPEELKKGLEREIGFKTELRELVKESGIEPVSLYAERMQASDIEKYQQFAALEEWVNEAGVFYNYDLMPTSVDLVQKESMDLPARYLCRIIGHIVDGDDDLYYFTIYDLKKGRVVYSRSEDAGRNISLRDLRKKTSEDLERIYN